MHLQVRVNQQVAELSKQDILRRYGAEYYGEKANTLIQETSQQEREEWINSNITKALILYLEEDIATYFVSWLGDPVEGAATEVEARGFVKGLNYVAAKIAEILE